MLEAFEDKVVVQQQPDPYGAYAQVGIRVSLPHIDNQLPEVEVVEEPREGACTVLGTEKALKSEVGFFILAKLIGETCTFVITLPTGEQATLWYSE